MFFYFAVVSVFFISFLATEFEKKNSQDTWWTSFCIV